MIYGAHAGRVPIIRCPEFAVNRREVNEVESAGPELDPREDALVEEFRTWLAANRSPKWKDFERHRISMPERARASREWESALGRGGWLGLSWPTEYGGRGMSMRGAALIARELAEAGAPELFNQVGLDLVGPALVRFGTEAQKRGFLPALLSGEIWCQGFSEPDAGSDLASLKTRAEMRDGAYVLTGQKVWSTFASEAQHCILLARTDPEAPKHRGLSCFLMPMEIAGLEIRPIIDITGDAEFFELFLNGCELTSEDMLGEPGRGWEIAMYVLTQERNAIFSLLGEVRRDMEGLVELVRALPADDPDRRALQARATELLIAETVVQWSNERATEHLAAGRPESRLEAIMKVSWSELHQEMVRTAVQAAGTAALLERDDPAAVEEGRWLWRYLHSRAETIYAGTSEIQRNIIAERVLGLPREPRA
jgi:alkylation response protein AidB-like acyl-CoA dehydrogenase